MTSPHSVGRGFTRPLVFFYNLPGDVFDIREILIDATAKKLRKYGKRIGKRMPNEKTQWVGKSLVTDLHSK